MDNSIEEALDLIRSGRMSDQMRGVKILFNALDGSVGDTKIHLLNRILDALSRSVGKTAGENLANHPDVAHEQLIRDHQFIPIPSGRFKMGCFKETLKAFEGNYMGYQGWETPKLNETPSQTFEIGKYEISKYPITLKQYRRFVDEKGYEDTSLWTEEGSSWISENDIKHPQGWGNPDENRDKYPIVGVSWYEAHAYSRWLQQKLSRPIFLPTEAQWEKAARGDDGRLFPWGDNIDVHPIQNPDLVLRPVGSFSPNADSPFGCCDMAGSVWQWCSSKFMPYPYKDKRHRVEQVRPDPEFPYRVLRGGSYIDPLALSRCSMRHWKLPEERTLNYGFRVVIDEHRRDGEY